MKRELLQILGEENVFFSEPLKKHCTFKVGGNAKVFATPTKLDDLIRVVDLAKEHNQKIKIIGFASNILFSDSGYDGIVISTKRMKTISMVDDGIVSVSAGVPIAELVSFATNNSLSGLEFLAGIPATVGGALCMNAGAWGNEIFSVVRSVSFLDRDKVVTKRREELSFGYRTSEFLNTERIILFAEFELKTGVKEQINRNVEEILSKRRNSQPNGFSAGCVFKKNGSISAGKLIDEAGLKGLRKNGAVVSPIHANFILNDGNATAEDVRYLIAKIKKEVYAKHGVVLDTEIEIVD